MALSFAQMGISQQSEKCGLPEQWCRGRHGDGGTGHRCPPSGVSGHERPAPAACAIFVIARGRTHRNAPRSHRRLRSHLTRSSLRNLPRSDRKSVVYGKSVSERVVFGGRRIITKKIKIIPYPTHYISDYFI